jgi:hypothetical protein
MTHLTFEQISELAESRTSRAESRDHVASCAECRATLERVQRLIESAQALPRDVVPPPEVWTALQARVKSAPPRVRAKSWSLGWLAAAAAVVFLVGSALLLPPSVGKSKGKGAVAPPPGAAVSPVVLAVEDCYSPAIRDLRRTLDQQRGTLSPSTLRVVERSLVTIDSAIAEARSALASDPANQALVQILSAQFEHKVDLLERATRLSSS